MVPHTGFVTGQSRGTQNGIPAFLCPAPSPAVTIHVIKLPFPRFVSHHSPTICSVCLTLLKSTNLYSVANSTAMASSNSPSKGPELGPITVQQIISPWTSPASAYKATRSLLKFHRKWSTERPLPVRVRVYVRNVWLYSSVYAFAFLLIAVR